MESHPSDYLNEQKLLTREMEEITKEMWVSGSHVYKEDGDPVIREMLK